MNVREAHSREDPSPDERHLWGALVEHPFTLALLRIGYEGSPAAQDAVDDAYQEGWDAGYGEGLTDAQKAKAAA